MRNSRFSASMTAATVMALAAGMSGSSINLPRRRDSDQAPAQTSARTYSADEIAYAERRRAEREREAWNRAVDKKKAERNARRGIYR